MDYRIIKSPSKGTLELVKRRMGLAGTSSFDHADGTGKDDRYDLCGRYCRKSSWRGSL